MKPDVIEGTGGKIEINETSDLKSVLPELDVMYVTRVQKERFADPAEYEKVKNAYIVNADLLKKGKKDVVVMHPLPRIAEIAKDVDPLPNAWYFRQVKHGIYARMAIMGLALGVL